jgi:hypothetical protein
MCGQLRAPIGWIGRVHQGHPWRDDEIIREERRFDGELLVEDKSNSVLPKGIGGNGWTSERFAWAAVPAIDIADFGKVETLGNRMPRTGSPANPSEEVDILERIGRPFPGIDDAMRSGDGDVGRNESAGALPFRSIATDIDLSDRIPGSSRRWKGNAVITSDNARTQFIGA